MSFSEHIYRDARLRILQALAEQTDRRLSDRALVYPLEAWGLPRSREFIRTQIRKLAEIGGVTIVTDSEAVLVPQITVAGLDHVGRRSILDGVLRPDPGE